MQKPYFIRVSSTKGGVGKSVIAINLAVALQLFGYRTLLVDSDTVNPSIGVYLGIADVNLGVVQALQQKVDIRRAIAPHSASGLHVLPGKIDSQYVLPTAEQSNSFFSTLEKLEYDFILVDTAPGIPFPEAIGHYDEALLVTLPDEVSCISAFKMIKQYSKQRLKTSIIVNRVANKRYELSIREIETMCENKVTGILPEDENVKKSIAEHRPLFLENRNAPFSRQMSAIGSVYASRSMVARVSQTRGWKAVVMNLVRFILGVKE